MKTQAMLVVCSVVTVQLGAFVHMGHTAEPERIPLWASGAPGEPATKPEDEPFLLRSRPAADTDTRTAIVVVPGGGYGHLAMDHEGKQIADWLNSLGVTAFV